MFDVEVFMASTSTWVAGCSTRSSGLLVSVVAGRGSVVVCGWAIWDICVVWVVV
jgi:hypothetical protein